MNRDTPFGGFLVHFGCVHYGTSVHCIGNWPWVAIAT